MQIIELTKGYKAIVDDDDFEKVSSYRWRTLAKKEGYAYAIANKKVANGKTTTISLHRFIMNPPAKMFVDHINGDGLDCRKKNMRICTHSENMRNRRITGYGSSKYKGVSWNSTNKKWYAHCVVDGKQKHLGVYDDEALAAKRYDEVAKIEYGEFAKLNFPKGVEPCTL